VLLGLYLAKHARAFSCSGAGMGRLCSTGSVRRSSLLGKFTTASLGADEKFRSAFHEIALENMDDAQILSLSRRVNSKISIIEAVIAGYL